ncbi:VanZ family protein [Winogradskyella wandonensis]|uniref:VanZ family protein n=1 Tax=Winogradskyella wandonensis TaxID=1442586 RepID=UPI00104A48D1|nr:VanZ family protein [Winogradskyella wandonensis]
MLKNPRAVLLVAILYTIVLLYFTFANAENVLPDTKIKHQDKIFHFIAYTGLAILWCYNFILYRLKRPLLIGFASTLVLGLFLELIQEKVNPLRTFDVLDLTANGLGVLLGTIVVALFFRKLKLK